LPPGNVQAAATAGLGELAGALAVPAAAGLAKQLAVLDLLLLLVQPPAAMPAAASRIMLAAVGRLTEHLI
jgi:hypothetical protein